MINLFVAIVLAVPMSVYLIGGGLSFGNILGQYVWVAIICFPPCLVQILLRFAIGLLIKNWLTKLSN
jgi:hypothetical protein